MRELLEELRFRLRAGPRSTATWIVDRLLDARHDRAFGIHTRAPSSQRSQPDFVHYQPVSYRDLNETLALAKINIRDVFLDIGSGLGRALCVAATYPVRRAIGIELSPELCAGAEQNIARVREKLRCPDVRVVPANALEYAIPPDVSLIFLFNPLSGLALRTLLERIGAAHREHLRPLRIVFTGTVSSERFRREAARHSFLQLAAERRLSTGARALLYNVQIHP